MPTEDYSSSLRTARIRNKAVVAGLNKVVRAFDNTIQSSFRLGQLSYKTKMRAGIFTDYGCGKSSSCFCGGVMDGGGAPNSVPQYFLNGGTPSSQATCFINGGLV